MNTFNAKEVKDRVVQWIRDWFEANGKVAMQLSEYQAARTAA